MVVISLPMDPLEKPTSRPRDGPSSAPAVVLLPQAVGPPQQRHPTLFIKLQQVLHPLVARTQLKKIISVDTIVNNTVMYNCLRGDPNISDHCSLLRMLINHRPGVYLTPCRSTWWLLRRSLAGRGQGWHAIPTLHCMGLLRDTEAAGSFRTQAQVPASMQRQWELRRLLEHGCPP